MVGEEGVEEARPTLDEELALDDDDVVDMAPKPGKKQMMTVGQRSRSNDATIGRNRNSCLLGTCCGVFECIS